MSFQNSAEWLNPSLNLEAQLSEVLIKKHPRAAHRALSEQLLKEVGMDADDLKRYPRELSGGMVQKFMFACAIALNPKLILLDEPTGALDYASRAGLIALVRKIHGAHNTAFVIITHDIAIARALCQRTLILYGGQVVEAGPTDDVFRAPRHPYAFGLTRAFPELYPYRDLWGIRAGQTPPGRGARCVFYGRCTQSIDRCQKSRPALEAVSPGRFVACHRGGVVKMLSAAGMHKRYGRQAVICGADVAVYAGEVVVVIGPSGSGKSTLCGMLGGYIKPDAGDICFDGAPADYTRLHRMRGGLQMAIQDGDGALNPRMSVLEAVSEPLRLNGAQEAEWRAAAVHALEGVGLPVGDGFLAQRIAALSGGQRQRVNLARALTLSPKILIADEPASMLDASSKANLLRTLKRLQNERGMALLMVTHDLDGARKIADRIYRLEAGRALPTDPDWMDQWIKERDING